MRSSSLSETMRATSKETYSALAFIEVLRGTLPSEHTQRLEAIAPTTCFGVNQFCGQLLQAGLGLFARGLVGADLVLRGSIGRSLGSAKCEGTTAKLLRPMRAFVRTTGTVLELGEFGGEGKAHKEREEDEDLHGTEPREHAGRHG